MKKIIISTLLSASLALGEIVNILPYGGTIEYGNDSTTSAKETAVLYGAHASIGTLSYLLEIDYAHINTQYKDSTLEDLSQDDITLAYASYSANIMFKVGGHYIDTNDEQLGNALIGIISIEGYNYFDYDKVSYGVNGFYSHYEKGHDENYEAKTVAITQLSPYLSYYKAININWGNTLLLKAHFQSADNYIQKEYSSYEISDTLFYKSLFLTLKYYDGEMRTGVKDSGFTVFNTLDLMKSGYSAKLGYYLTKDAILSASYGQNSYVEYGLVKENTNDVAIASLSYSF